MRVALILIALLCATQCALAAGARKIALPKDESPLAAAWRADGQALVLVSRKGGGLALRIADPATGDVELVAPPRGQGLALSDKVYLSPIGTAVAVISPSANQNAPAQLSIWATKGGAATQVSLRDISPDFFPGTAAWKDDGSILFVAAAPYIKPEQPDSVIAVDAVRGGVQPAVIKGNLDLVDQLAYIPGRGMLAVKCRGIRGEYPSEPVVAIVTPSQPDMVVLHAEAQEFTLDPLADGTLLLEAPQSARQRWILPPGQTTLRLFKPALPGTAWVASPDGKWLGTLADGRAVKRTAGQTFGVLQSTTGTRFVTSAPCAGLVFSPDSRKALAFAPGQIVSIELP